MREWEVTELSIEGKKEAGGQQQIKTAFVLAISEWNQGQSLSDDYRTLPQCSDNGLHSPEPARHASQKQKNQGFQW